MFCDDHQHGSNDSFSHTRDKQSDLLLLETSGSPWQITIREMIYQMMSRLLNLAKGNKRNMLKHPKKSFATWVYETTSFRDLGNVCNNMQHHVSQQNISFSSFYLQSFHP